MEMCDKMKQIIWFLLLLPAAIWPAHLAEVVVENFLFGLVVAWGLRPLPAKPIPHLAT